MGSGAPNHPPASCSRVNCSWNPRAQLERGKRRNKCLNIFQQKTITVGSRVQTSRPIAHPRCRMRRPLRPDSELEFRATGSSSCPSASHSKAKFSMALTLLSLDWPLNSWAFLPLSLPCAYAPQSSSPNWKSSQGLIPNPPFSRDYA